MAEHMELEPYERERVCAIAVRLINPRGSGSAPTGMRRLSRTHGVTTLTRRHVTVRGTRLTFRFRAKHRAQVRTTIVDAELAEAFKELVAQPGGARIFRYRWNGDVYPLTGAVLNDYIRKHLGQEFTAKDFRTWGGTLTAAIALAEHGLPESETEAKRTVANVMRTRRRAARKHTSGGALLVRQPGRGRAVSRRQNDRGLSSTPFASRQGADIELDPRSRRSSACSDPGEYAVRSSGVISPCIPVTVARGSVVLEGGTLWLARPCSFPTSPASRLPKERRNDSDHVPRCAQGRA